MTRKHAVGPRVLPRGIPIEDAFAMAARAGFAGVEMLPSAGPEEAAAVHAASRSTGVRVSAVEAGGANGCALLDREGEELEANVGLALTAIRNAADWGADRVLVVPGRVDGHMPPEVSWQRSAEVIATRLVPLAEELGVTLGIENTWLGFLSSAGEQARFVDEQDSAAVGAYLDTGNLVFGHPQHWVPVLGERLVGVHYKDSSLRVMFDVGLFRITRTGAGDIDWPTVDLALAAAGYDGWITHPSVPPSPPVRVANRLGRTLARRPGTVAGAAVAALEGRLTRLQARQLRDLGRRARVQVPGGR